MDHDQVVVVPRVPAFNFPLHSFNPPRPQKRRFDHDDSPSDDMDRSPTPERPKRVQPKRVRLEPSPPSSSNNDHTPSKGEVKSDEDELDLGVLLAKLPPQSLLLILTSVISSQPHLKPLILSLIPRPTLETALNALADAARKLRDAYPYSQPSAPHPPPSMSFGFGSVPSYNRAGAFGARPTTASSSRTGGMRDEYVLSRLRPPISEFVSTALSYLSYFSFLPSSNTSATPQSLAGRQHPSETFSYLSALTGHIFQQPPLSVSALSASIQPRLILEWEAWVGKVDWVVNTDGGMFSAEVVRSWERDLDNFAAQTQFPLGQNMKAIRDKWVTKVGWLIGRTAMEEGL